MVEGAAAKIMDFGISRRDSDTATPAGTTTRNEIVGTPPYMAPEQELGQPVPASDLYALGVSAYEMLAGRRPFGSSHGLMDKLEARFQPLSQAKPGLAPGLDAVLAKALAGKPEARFATARDFLAGLEKAVS
jgi:serine/threonine-protein kinase